MSKPNRYTNELTKLTLDSMCNGDPNKEFEKYVQTAVNELRSGQKATITITVSVFRPESTTQLGLSADVKLALPKKSVASMVIIGADNEVFTDKPSVESAEGMFDQEPVRTIETVSEKPTQGIQAVNDKPRAVLSIAGKQDIDQETGKIIEGGKENVL